MYCTRMARVVYVLYFSDTSHGSLPTTAARLRPANRRPPRHPARLFLRFWRAVGAVRGVACRAKSDARSIRVDCSCVQKAVQSCIVYFMLTRKHSVYSVLCFEACGLGGAMGVKGDGLASCQWCWLTVCMCGGVWVFNTGFQIGL